MVAVAGGILYLYRREGRMISRKARLTLAALRFLTLGGVLAMLLEPAIIFVNRETIPSRLLVLVDNSQSMDFQDAYVDAPQARRIVAALKLKSVAALRGQSRLALAERALNGGLLTRLAAGGDRVVTRQNFSGELFEPPPAIPSMRSTAAPDRSTTGIGTAVKQRWPPIAGSRWPAFCC